MPGSLNDNSYGAVKGRLATLTINRSIEGTNRRIEEIWGLPGDQFDKMDDAAIIRQFGELLNHQHDPHKRGREWQAVQSRRYWRSTPTDGPVYLNPNTGKRLTNEEMYVKGLYPTQVKAAFEARIKADAEATAKANAERDAYLKSPEGIKETARIRKEYEAEGAKQSAAEANLHKLTDAELANSDAAYQASQSARDAERERRRVAREETEAKLTRAHLDHFTPRQYADLTDTEIATLPEEIRHIATARRAHAREQVATGPINPLTGQHTVVTRADAATSREEQLQAQLREQQLAIASKHGIPVSAARYINPTANSANGLFNWQWQDTTPDSVLAEVARSSGAESLNIGTHRSGQNIFAQRVAAAKTAPHEDLSALTKAMEAKEANPLNDNNDLPEAKEANPLNDNSDLPSTLTVTPDEYRAIVARAEREREARLRNPIQGGGMSGRRIEGGSRTWSEAIKNEFVNPQSVLRRNAVPIGLTAAMLLGSAVNPYVQDAAHSYDQAHRPRAPQPAMPTYSSGWEYNPNYPVTL